uniref:hypothetical protein n=1 Tax=Flavobacterium sp. GP15 TaxID=2758567 RepID=UPI00165E88F7
MIDNWIESQEKKIKTETKKVPYTAKELSEVIDFIKTKKTISMKDLEEKFNKEYIWVASILETLEQLYMIDIFSGERQRDVFIYSNQADA